MLATFEWSDAVPATLVSNAVRPTLEGVRRATVHSVFRSAINLEAGRAFLTLGNTDLGPMPNGIVIGRGPDFLHTGLRSGQAVQISGKRITVPGIGLEIDLRAARQWDPRLVTRAGDRSVAVARWQRRSAFVRSIAAARARPCAGFSTGLGELLTGDGVPPTGVVALLARPRLDRLASAIGARDSAIASRLASGLVGLGPGLTPSGDDALVGIAAAAAALGKPDAVAFLRPIAEGALERTTIVAATFLRHASVGEFSGRFHDLLVALLGPDDTALIPAVDRALAWGATSGADSLVGVLLGLDVLGGVPAWRNVAARTVAA